MPGAVEFKSRRECLLLAHAEPTSYNTGLFIHLSPKIDEILLKFEGEHVLVEVNETKDEDRKLIILSCGSYHPRPNSLSSNDYQEDGQSLEFYHLLPISASTLPHLEKLISDNETVLRTQAVLRVIVERL